MCRVPPQIIYGARVRSLSAAITIGGSFNDASPSDVAGNSASDSLPRRIGAGFPAGSIHSPRKWNRSRLASQLPAWHSETLGPDMTVSSPDRRLGEDVNPQWSRRAILRGSLSRALHNRDAWIRLSRRAMACSFEVTLARRTLPMCRRHAPRWTVWTPLKIDLTIFRDTSTIVEINRRAADEPVVRRSSALRSSSRMRRDSPSDRRRLRHHVDSPQQVLGLSAAQRATAVAGRHRRCADECWPRRRRSRCRFQTGAILRDGRRAEPRRDRQRLRARPGRSGHAGGWRDVTRCCRPGAAACSLWVAVTGGWSIESDLPDGRSRPRARVASQRGARYQRRGRTVRRGRRCSLRSCDRSAQRLACVGILSATVIADRAAAADALSTAFFIGGPTLAPGLLRQSSGHAGHRHPAGHRSPIVIGSSPRRSRGGRMKSEASTYLPASRSRSWFCER